MFCSTLIAVSASFLSPLPAQTRQPGSVARSAVKMLPPAPPTAEEKARKSFVQYEMRSESSRTDTCTLARHRPVKPARAAARPALSPACRPPSPPAHAPPSHSPPARQRRAECMHSQRARVRAGAAMKLHTRDQAPKEGQQPAEKPVSKWEPGREEYLQFLVDSRRRRPPLHTNPDPLPLPQASRC